MLHNSYAVPEMSSQVFNDNNMCLSCGVPVWILNQYPHI